MAARPDDSQRQHAEIEQRVRDRWLARDVAGEARRRRAGAPARGIWESGGVAERVLADVFARYATMRGWDVELSGGAAAADRCAPGDRLGIAQPVAAARDPSDPGYVESVWWALREIFDRGLLYEDVKVEPYCPRCATPLTGGEVVDAEVTDPSAYVRFKVARDGGPLQAGDELLVWTTAPWTLVANAAVAVDPELTYVRAKTGTLDPPVVLAEALVEDVLGDGGGVRILERFRGAAIDGLRYEAPLGYLPAGAFGERGHTVLLAGFVTATEGTGLVSVAPAFGEDDLHLATRYGLALINPVGTAGAFDERVGRYAGRAVKDAETRLLEDLRARGRLLRATTRAHAVAHCAQCATRVLPYATASWYVATSRLLDAPAPPRAPATDHLLSHRRVRGTPLPVWRCEHGHATVVGSFDELEQRSGERLGDPHRPHADDVAFACACGEPATRVPDLVQPWFEAGAMPFAAHHEPFTGERTLDELYPADLVCATSADLASLRTVAALLRSGEQVADHVARAGACDATAAETLDRGGADAARCELVAPELSSLSPQLWPAFALAAAHAPSATGAEPAELDRWIASRLSATVAIAGERLDAYDAPGAARAITTFAEDLCGWYLRRSAERLRSGDPAACHTLRHCLVTLSQLLAPFTPFLADEMYEHLSADEPSVHLTDWPVAGTRDVALETAVGRARNG